ncbi:histidine phosphatase family protein [Anabaena cylindrica FACHB-243]|uniref:Phosphoglycerate mutase n=1 Tax=Anabaena cylindrica (strain ATCC 27899 / PCC 7122) TaxID=272123 RepID=K9ZIY5_ANACC|nr:MULTISPECIES: histidine phosphatase family protein [Anabaena]AFZ58527.1 Phosphoglycerate mutase [Anabaena cylindrica PCC 7122]MBD2416290.1 histidine phosphatase family protein [Anabaena cylindrica FACHB-243]MBY5283279.1 histidine phosphatase family protein [Anabaena sp. CCAP 1446/1C]MBY5307960.1 histidine phosphatase family protein [Anabaena sp. CCAP 1446/1C]MCM2407331.1 histidine phosphatase family protein [Anabaena sp. CCAP 1446/1C]
MTRVIIVRHGQSTYNIERRIQGRTDASTLTDQGRIDAGKTGEALSNIAFTAIYSSPLNRAKTTAEIIHGHLREKSAVIQISENLVEVDLPLWAGMLSSDVKDKFADDYSIWKKRPHELRMIVNDGQGTRELFPVLALYEQAKQFWQEILSRHQGETILIVGHNGINRALISTALGIPPSGYHGLQQSNCGISVLNFAGGLGESVQLESMNQTQHLGEALPTLRPSHQGFRLLLVRHGETEWNRQGKFQGQIDVPLNDNGRNQAGKAGEFLKDVAIDFAFSSTMARPKETAEIILNQHPHIKLELLDGLREISHGTWEGKFEAEIEQEFPGELERWRNVPAEVQMPAGENLQQVRERSVVAWQSILQAAEVNQFQIGLVVAHDATNKTLLCHILGLSSENFWNFRQGNGAVSVIDYPSGANGLPILQAMNITSHLSGGVLDKTAAGAL